MPSWRNILQHVYTHLSSGCRHKDPIKVKAGQTINELKTCIGPQANKGREAQQPKHNIEQDSIYVSKSQILHTTFSYCTGNASSPHPVLTSTCPFRAAQCTAVRAHRSLLCRSAYRSKESFNLFCATTLRANMATLKNPFSKICCLK